MIPGDVFSGVVAPLIVAAVLGMGGWLFKIWDTQRSHARQLRMLNIFLIGLSDNIPDERVANAYRQILRDNADIDENR